MRIQIMEDNYKMAQKITRQEEEITRQAEEITRLRDELNRRTAMDKIVNNGYKKK